MELLENLPFLVFCQLVLEFFSEILFKKIYLNVGCSLLHFMLSRVAF